MNAVIKAIPSRLATTTRDCSTTAITARLVAMLVLLKAGHPSRMSTVDLRDSLTKSGNQYTLRSVQRYLNGFALMGLVKGDGELPQGWRLTDAGKELLGVQS
jgi:hypothetical protein